MALVDEIAAAEKEFAEAIKDAEAQKKAIDALDAEAARNGSDFSKEAQRVVAAFKQAQDNLGDWSAGYDVWIGGLKDLVKDFAAAKKKSSDADKFYEQLKDEKDDRDKARKKAGPGTKPSKEDEIADAAFKKAKTAYENDPGKEIEGVLKSIRASTKEMESTHKSLVMDLNKASKDYDVLCKQLRDFADVTTVSKWDKKYKMDKNPMGAEFDDYFKKMK